MDRPQKLNFKGRLRKGFVLEATLKDVWSNVVCSPVSALLPLGKLALGAEGPTKLELLRAVGVSTREDISIFKKIVRDLQFLPGVVLTIASKIYVSETTEILSDFYRDATEIFHSAVETTSFSNPEKATNEINEWVSKETKGMIPMLVDPGHITPATSLLIVNAVHFKGKWEIPFDPDKVEVKDFYAPSGAKKVQMMQQTGWFRYAESDALSAQILEIPYQGAKASFIIVLPSDKAGLPILLNQLKLNPKLIDQELGTLHYMNVDLTIPKFKITSKLDLKELYKKIGMNYMFGHHSGLSRIVKNDELRISSAIQKAIIEVHETGTEASAASYLPLLGASLMLPPEPVVFRADHPFLYYVEANKEEIFGGIFSEP